jgi:hypothetical protein
MRAGESLHLGVPKLPVQKTTLFILSCVEKTVNLVIWAPVSRPPLLI